MPDNADDDKLKSSTRLALCSAVGAILVLLANVYGSGSYLEPFSEDTGKVIKASLFAFSGLMASYLAVEIATLFDHLFGIRKTSPIRYEILNTALSYSLVSFVLASIFLLLFFIAEIISPGLDQTNTQIGLIINSILAVILFSTTLVLYMIVEFLQNQRIVFSISILVLVGFYLILFNLVRDAEKAAFVTDAEFCYWKLASNEIPPHAVCDKFNGGFSSYSVELNLSAPKQQSQGN